MGSISYCICIEEKTKKLSESEIIIKKFEKYTNDANLSNEEIKDNNHIKKFDYDVNNNSLTPQNDFNNPLPNIVILKHKKF